MPRKRRTEGSMFEEICGKSWETKLTRAAFLFAITIPQTITKLFSKIISGTTWSGAEKPAKAESSFRSNPDIIIKAILNPTETVIISDLLKLFKFKI